jgi:hypothetical protein
MFSGIVVDGGCSYYSFQISHALIRHFGRIITLGGHRFWSSQAFHFFDDSIADSIIALKKM